MVGEQSGPLSDEQVFVVQEDGGVRIGLFIDQRVLDRLQRHDPLDALDERNLDDFCTALEGVSHFHYLIWSFARGRSVSLLELELQAEVDKYATALALLTQQRAGVFPGALHARMFSGVSFLPQLDDGQPASLRRGESARGALLPRRWISDTCTRAVGSRRNG